MPRQAPWQPKSLPVAGVAGLCAELLPALDGEPAETEDGGPYAGEPYSGARSEKGILKFVVDEEKG